MLSWTTRPSDVEVADVVALLAAAATADGVEPVSEATRLRLRHPDSGSPHSAVAEPPGPDSALHLLVHGPAADRAAGPAGVLVGYAGVDRGAGRAGVEFAVHPGYRRRGIGAAMLATVLSRVSGPLGVWAHGEHPAALRLAQRAGLVRMRELWQLRRTLTGPPARRSLPEGIRLRPFVPGRDEHAVVQVNNRAFAWHPEQGRWGTAELMLREREPWFDPEGFLLAVDAGQELRGFHWTKVHPDGLGEVYVLGVDPAAAGTGLGGALTVAGLEHLRARGVTEVLLFVESDNVAALRLYDRLGFRHHHTDVEFLRA